MEKLLNYSGLEKYNDIVQKEITDLKEDLSAVEVYGIADFPKLVSKWIRPNGTIGDSNPHNVGYIVAKPNTRYAVKIGAGDEVKVSYSTATPVVNLQTYGLTIGTTEVDITTGADAVYLTFQYPKTTASVRVIEVGGDYSFAYNWYTPSLRYDKNYIVVQADSDFNDLTTVGNYRVGTTAIAQTIANIPVKAGGRLTVYTLNAATAYMQIYDASGGARYRRTYSLGAWTEWTTITNREWVKSNAIATTYTNATAITAGADLDEYKTAGNYYISSGSIASQVNNIPRELSGRAGRLTVVTLNASASIKQIYEATSISVNGVMTASRMFVSGAWTGWILEVTPTYMNRISRDSIVLYDKMAIAGASEAINVLRKSMPYNIKFANATAPLWLVNYAGNTQNCHPKVLYFASAFGGHKYWMAYTPYPYCNDDYENPCIAYSDDGYHFINIAGNPLDDPQGNGYNSDTHLVYNTNTDKMEVWWRYVNDATPQETIYRMTTSDGITWSEKEIVYNNTSGTQTNFESPCVIYDNGTYKIWVCTYQNGIRYYEASENDITNWTLVRSLPFSIQDEGINVMPWHIDVINENGTYIMAIMCRNGASLTNNICSVFLTTSQDNITYTSPYKVISGNVGVWDKVLYRTCILKVPSGYRLYYTGETGGNSDIYGDARWGLGISESDSLTNFYGVCKNTRVND